MIYLVLENPNNVINSLTDSFKKHFKESSIVYLTSECRIDYANNFIHPPLFDRSWYFICKGSVNVKLIEKLESLNSRNIILITVNNRNALETWQEKLKGLHVYLVDNYRVKKNDVVAWIADQLGTDYDLSSLIYSRLNGNLYDVVNNVSTLATLSIVTRQDVLRYVHKRSKFSHNDFILFMLGENYKKMTKEDAIGVLYDFRYASSWFYKKVLEELEFIIHVYELMLDSSLNLTNFREYRSNTNDTKIKSASEYHLKHTVEMFSRVSLEYVYFLYLNVKKYQGKHANIYKLIKFIKIV